MRAKETSVWKECAEDLQYYKRTRKEECEFNVLDCEITVIMYMYIHT